ncbi:DUF4153 domain-containing protein [Ralstonia solanacearum]|uniref:DUF4153 domain-containing protein n=1 Tax=Ralstonia solanacearum TaxID=305 RepID=UPI0005C4606F|nr:DUF4153 domain-containing protein [Ralstonia solanacearum]MBB6589992.1 DUF4153 domain-containing protein [Ralstonia solanacearum]MBB6594189.1 DUF4153 domain-containing protein [Ralstonia solanacearum]MDB0542886.1 DUF4153 domain-containing protein [Ralstonia solanacearum]MDB0553113.1 DUF4153 domain-containing protein [Ralstonia solanacearum]MDB0557892.1 DUF4153 domain-containing protein [Ralstonia solanacearum]
MPSLRLMLIALAQGVGLYLCGRLAGTSLPDAQRALLAAAHTVLVFGPTAYYLCERPAAPRRLLGLLALAALLIGALTGYSHWMGGTTAKDLLDPGRRFLVSAVLWGLALPLIQLRADGRALTDYPALFQASWRDAILVIDAAIFTGVFWSVLFLGAQLFDVIGLHLFREIIQKAAFAWPATTLCFAYAVQLCRRHAVMVESIQRHALSACKWLLPLTLLIAAGFVLALPFTGLKALWATRYAATLLLWLLAVSVLFINAAYGDGTEPPGYPRWLAATLRAGMLALPVLGGLALVALGLRIRQHGLTVERIWGMLVAVAGCVYALGYAAAALRRGAWLGGIGRINVTVALGLIVAIALLTGPLLEQHRLAADSQVARLATGKVAADKFDYDALRFDMGRPGRDALARLVADTALANHAEIGRRATAALAKQRRWGNDLAVDFDTLLAGTKIYPAGATLPADFIDFARAHQDAFKSLACEVGGSGACGLIMLDLNGDGQIEILPAAPQYRPELYSRTAAGWKAIGYLEATEHRCHHDSADTGTDAATAITVVPLWKDVMIGKHRWVVVPDLSADCPTAKTP